MMHVTSSDGTPIAYECTGSGPVIILVGGGLDDGSENVPLAAELAREFTVYNYARRGRAGSGDTPPYALEREFDDIQALIADAGTPVHLFGVSSGGGLVLEAAAARLTIDRLAVYDVPYCMDEEMRQRAQTFAEQVGPMLAEGRRDDALELFMWLAGSSPDDIAGAKNSPYWPGLVTIAHTLAYDAACMGDYRPPSDRLATITRPTLVLTGGLNANQQHGTSRMPPDFYHQAADAIATSIPTAQRLTLQGRTHVPNPKELGPVLKHFFNPDQQ